MPTPALLRELDALVRPAGRGAQPVRRSARLLPGRARCCSRRPPAPRACARKAKGARRSRARRRRGTPRGRPRSRTPCGALRRASRGGPPAPGAEQALLEALGPNPARFAQSYRELGQFERPGPEGREVVVRVEARIETNAVAAALGRAGLLAASASAPSAGAGSRLVIEPLPAWPLLHAVQKRLSELGARRVTPERGSARRRRARARCRPLGRLARAGAARFAAPRGFGDPARRARRRARDSTRSGCAGAARRLTRKRRKGNWVRSLGRLQARSSAG